LISKTDFTHTTTTTTRQQQQQQQMNSKERIFGQIVAALLSLFLVFHYRIMQCAEQTALGLAADRDLLSDDYQQFIIEDFKENAQNAVRIYAIDEDDDNARVMMFNETADLTVNLAVPKNIWTNILDEMKKAFEEPEWQRIVVKEYGGSVIKAWNRRSFTDREIIEKIKRKTKSEIKKMKDEFNQFIGRFKSNVKNAATIYVISYNQIGSDVNLRMLMFDQDAELTVNEHVSKIIYEHSRQEMERTLLEEETGTADEWIPEMNAMFKNFGGGVVGSFRRRSFTDKELRQKVEAQVYQ